MYMICNLNKKKLRTNSFWKYESIKRNAEAELNNFTVYAKCLFLKC